VEAWVDEKLGSSPFWVVPWLGLLCYNMVSAGVRPVPHKGGMRGVPCLENRSCGVRSTYSHILCW